MTKRRSPWILRAVAAVLGGGLTYVLLATSGVEVDAFAFVVLVAVAFALVGLLFDALDESAVRWELPLDRASRDGGADTRTALYRRLLESSVSKKIPDDTAQRRLAELASIRLRTLHGVEVTSVEARELLGAETVETLLGPARRLDRETLDRVITSIEAV